jgi:hypothetical protein
VAVLRTRTAIILALAGVLLVAVGGYAAVRWRQVSQYPRKFAAVAIGDIKERVIEKMGEPDGVRSKPDWLWCNVGACESEFLLVDVSR